jgi:hypothetical protein
MEDRETGKKPPTFAETDLSPAEHKRCQLPLVTCALRRMDELAGDPFSKRMRPPWADGERAWKESLHQNAYMSVRYFNKLDR